MIRYQSVPDRRPLSPRALKRWLWLGSASLVLLCASVTAGADELSDTQTPQSPPESTEDIALSLSRLDALEPFEIGFGAPVRLAIKDDFDQLTRTLPRKRFFSLPEALRLGRRTGFDQAILPPMPGVDPRQSVTRRTNGGNLTLGYDQPWFEGQLSMTATLEPLSEGLGSRYSNPTDRRDLVGRDSLKLGSGLQYRHSLADNFDIDLKASLRHEISDQTTRQDSERLWLFNEGTSAMISDMSGTAQWQGQDGLRVSFGGQSRQSERYTHAYVTADDQLITAQPLQRIDEARSDVYLTSQLQPIKKVDVSATLSLVNQSLNQTNNSGALERALGRKTTFVRPDVKLKWQPLQRLAVWFGLRDDVKSLGYEDLLRPDDKPKMAVEPERRWTSAVSVTYPITDDVLPINGEFALSAERSRVENAIDHTIVPEGDGFVDIRGNIGTAQSQDISARLSLKAARYRWQGFGSDAMARTTLEMQATWRTSRVRDPISQDQRPISGVSPLSLSLNFRQALRQEGVIWGVWADNGWKNTTWRSNEISISRSGPRINLFAEFIPPMGRLEGLKLRAEVNNLTHQTQSYERLVFDDLRSAPDAKMTQSQWSQQAEPFVVLRLLKAL